MKAAGLPLGLKEGFRCILQPKTTLSPLRNRVLNVQRKQFSTATRCKAGIAAPEITFKGQRGWHEEDESDPTFYARLVPESAAYFTAQPNFTDDLLKLEHLLQKYSSLPRLKPEDVPRVAWQPLNEYKTMVGETIKTSKYTKIVETLRQLNTIHPDLMPKQVREVLDEYKRDIDPYSNVAKPIPIDADGRARGLGRRKTSTARAWVVEGTGEILVNGKTLAEAFGRIHDRESAIWALKATDRIDKYNVWALVSGGGTTGQAEALTLAVAKGLMAHEPALKAALRRGESIFYSWVSLLCLLRYEVSY